MFQIYEAPVIHVNDDRDSPLCRRRDEVHRFASIFTLNMLPFIILSLHHHSDRSSLRITRHLEMPVLVVVFVIHLQL